jgi:hypothetical protein
MSAVEQTLGRLYMEVVAKMMRRRFTLDYRREIARGRQL